MYDVIIIGTGPAGLMSAIESSKKNNVLIIEKNNKPGKKLLITGGGRCNITNLKSNNNFLDQIEHNRKYLYSIINTFGPKEIYEFFKKNNIKLKEEKENKIFPTSNKSEDILKALLKNVDNSIINYNETVIKIIYHPNNITIITSKSNYATKKLIIATGGASFPKTGSNGDHIKFAKMLNQPIIDLYPVEGGVILNNVADLIGISLDNVKIICNKKSYTGNLIFTHKGLSGSSIMKACENIYLNNIKTIFIDFLPNIDNERLYNLVYNYNRDKELNTFLNNYFPKRLCLYLIQKVNINSNIKIKQLCKSQILKLINIIKHCDFNINKTCDIAEAYVTGGGIDLKYIDTKTMESKINKGIYFVGECLDIHGPIGGYNITLALSTGYIAGTSIGD